VKIVVNWGAFFKIHDAVDVLSIIWILKKAPQFTTIFTKLEE
jgi:hypothetical protein